jgi:hypothetical protein
MDWQTWHDDYDRPVDPRVGFCAQLCATGRDGDLDAWS